MRPSHFLIALGIVLFVTLAGIGYYGYVKLQIDDEPLDYSSLDVELGPRDSEINGYSKLRAVTDGMQWDFGRHDEEGLAMSPFYPEAHPLTTDELRAIINAHSGNIAQIEDALAMEVFQFDQDATPNTLVPEIGQFQAFARNQVFHARLLAREGEPDAALARLITLSQQIQRFADSQGGLIIILTALAAADMCNDEIDYLVAHYPLSADALRQALVGYALRGAMEQNLATCIKLEFQFCVYCIDHLGELAEEEGSDSTFPWLKKNKPNPFVFKPNRTKNELYTNYADAIEQLALPANQRHFDWADKIEREHNKGFLQMLVSGNAVGTLLQAILVPAYAKVFEKAALGDFHSEATYLMLALRLYKLEHDALPSTLEALAPDYIEAAPRDPYDWQPLRYNAERAILYSIGMDNEDMGGSESISRLDYTEPDFELEFNDDYIAEQDKYEPTFHIRFDLEPRDFSADEEEQQP
ncbi:hypothetical protein [Cerasicoccus frondis]|uniref:hypothetical protein n=1 Tax=Cerasicoccus frondis TaxID=490090 RepID=UPI0028527B8C|nr:hypothetical protein [Cerasicoccus frondis]